MPPPRPPVTEQLISDSSDTSRVKELEEENQSLKWWGKVGAGVLAFMTGAAGLLLYAAVKGSSTDGDGGSKKKKSDKK